MRRGIYIVGIESTAHARENAEYEEHSSMLVEVQTYTATLEVIFTEN